jgi:hypothetical protein
MYALSRIARHLWLVLVVLAAGGPAARAQAGESAVVAWARALTWETLHLHENSAIVLETRASDVPALTVLLTTGTEPQRQAAARALGYGGGDSAIAALRANPDAAMSAREMLDTAIALRGTAADMVQLLKSIDGGPERWAPTNIVLTLGARRVTAAVPLLERRVRQDDAGGFDARCALAWIQRGPADVRALPAATDEDQAIAAVLRVGLPIAEDGAVFDDETRGGVWILDGDAWRFRPGARAGRESSLSFTVGFNEDRTRALVSVAHVCGSLCGSGYDYLLTREAGGWAVRAVMHTWVS